MVYFGSNLPLPFLFVSGFPIPKYQYFECFKTTLNSYSPKIKKNASIYYYE